MVSIPTSVFGILGFLIIAVTLYTFLEPQESHVAITSNQINSDFDAIQSSNLKANQSDSWYAGIQNTANFLIYGFSIIIEFIELPFNMSADWITMTASLPTDAKPIITILINIAVISAIAIFIRRG